MINMKLITISKINKLAKMSQCTSSLKKLIDTAMAREHDKQKMIAYKTDVQRYNYCLAFSETIWLLSRLHSDWRYFFGYTWNIEKRQNINILNNFNQRIFSRTTAHIFFRVTHFSLAIWWMMRKLVILISFNMQVPVHHVWGERSLSLPLALIHFLASELSLTSIREIAR